MPRPSAREFLSSSQKLSAQQQELRQQVEQLEAERSQLLQQLKQAGQVVQEGVEVPIAQILRRSYQSRREKDPVAHGELVESIKRYGFRGAIWVQRLPDNSLRLIAGESRLEAAIDAGLHTIKADVIDTDDITAVKLSRVENVRRRNLNELDDTKELLYLLSLVLERSEKDVIKLLRQMKNAEEGKASPLKPTDQEKIRQTFAEVAPEISWQSFVSVRLRLLNLPEDVMQVYNTGKLSYTKALAIAQVENEGLREEILEECVSDGWSLEDVKRQIKTRQNDTQTGSNPSHPVINRLEKIEQQVQAITPKKVQKMTPKQKADLLGAIARLEQLLQSKKAELDIDSEKVVPK